MKKVFLIVVGFVVLGAAGYFLSQGKQTQQPVEKFEASQTTFKKGQTAPDVAFIDFEGQTHHLSEFQGKAAVLDFWAAWCPFCLEEMVELQKAHDKHKDQLIMIGVHRTDTESKETGLKFAKGRGVSYLLVSDQDGSLYRAAGGFGMPVAVFIDKGGVVQEIKSGPKTAEEIQEKIGKLIE